MTLVANTFDLTPANQVMSKLDQNFAQMMIIAASGRVVGSIAAITTLASITPASDGTFEVSANVRVTVATNHSFTVTCSYSDESGTGRVLTMPFVLVAGSAIVNTVANANGTVPYMGIPIHIRAKGGSGITIATTGTFTTVTYNVEAIIKQLA